MFEQTNAKYMNEALIHFFTHADTLTVTWQTPLRNCYTYIPVRFIAYASWTFSPAVDLTVDGRDSIFDRDVKFLE